MVKCFEAFNPIHWEFSDFKNHNILLDPMIRKRPSIAT